MSLMGSDPLLAHRPRGQVRKAAVMALLLGLCLGTLLFAPATWLAQGVAGASQGRLLMPNARGTLWNGQADLVLSSGAGNTSAAALPQGIRWAVRPTWTTQGPALEVRLDAPCCTAEGLSWRLGWNGGAELSLAPHRSQWPTQWLSGLGTPWNTLDFAGRLLIDTPGLRLRWAQGRPLMTGTADLVAEDLSTRLTTLSALGSYRVHIDPDTAGGVKFALSTLRGELKLTGEGQWNPGHFRFRGVAEAQATSVDPLSNLLNILGRREGSRAHMSLG